ncbi:MAG: hypothetical protein M0R46_08055 [Candidatus Muirbacterium halophilum]|nr:hypothetical protein [Candidatus Muirbacterium halophilum]
MNKLLIIFLILFSLTCQAKLYFTNIQQNISESVLNLFEKPGNFDKKSEIAIYCSEFNRLFKEKINVGEIIELLGKEQRIKINFNILDAYIISGFTNNDFNSAKKIEYLLQKETDLIYKAIGFLKLSSYYFIMGNVDDAIRILLELEQFGDNNPIITEPLKEFLEKQDKDKDKHLKDLLTFFFETILNIPYAPIKNQSFSSLAVAYAYIGSDDKAQNIISKLEYPEFIDDTYTRIAYINMSQGNFEKAFDTGLKISNEEYRYSICMDIIRNYGEKTIPDWGFFEKVFFKIKKFFGKTEKRKVDFELSIIKKIAEKKCFENIDYTMEILSDIALMLYYNNHFKDASDLTAKIIQQTKSEKVRINNLGLIYLLEDKKKAEKEIDIIKEKLEMPNNSDQEYFDTICALADYYNKTEQNSKKKDMLKLMDEYLDIIIDDYLRVIIMFEKCNEYRWLLTK